MSTEPKSKTYQALDDAVRAHIASKYDAPVIVTDYLVLVAAEGMDETITHYHYATREGMPRHGVYGLLRWFQVKFEQGDDE